LRNRTFDAAVPDEPWQFQLDPLDLDEVEIWVPAGPEVPREGRGPEVELASGRPDGDGNIGCPEVVLGP
jgi:hypothetical protein